MLAAGDGNPRGRAACCSIAAPTRAPGPNATRRRSATPAPRATKRSVRLLLEHGAEVNVRNIRGYSPLMLAASSDAIPAGGGEVAAGQGRRHQLQGRLRRNRARPRRQARRHRRHAAAGRTAATGGAAMAVARLRPPRRIDPGRRRAGARDGREAELQLHSHRRLQLVSLAGSGVGGGRPSRAAAASSAPQIPQLPPVDDAVAGTPDRSRASSASPSIGVGAVRLRHERRAEECLHRRGRARDQGDADAAGQLVGERKPAAADERRRFPGGGPRHLRDQALHAGGRRSDAATQAIATAVAWLESAHPKTTQDRAFHALALAWANDGSESARRAVRALIAMQRIDGGWSQLTGTESDAYATGQVLFALSVAGRMSASDPVYPERRSTICFGRRRPTARGT